jgi:hypothetical protein
MQSQGLHLYARFGKKPIVEGEEGGGGDGEIQIEFLKKGPKCR